VGESLRLEQDEIARFRHDGFLAIDGPFLPQDDLRTARQTIDELYQCWDELPHHWAYDSGAVKYHAGQQQVGEIRHTFVLAPDLAKLAMVARCRVIAGQLLGADRVWCHFDHVVYKAPSEATRVRWHQDVAYSSTKLFTRAVHMWIPFQDVDIVNGCMQFIPGSHRHGSLTHQDDRSGRSRARFLASVDDSSMVVAPLALGGLTVHTPYTVHSTAPNRSGDLRRAWVLQFATGPMPAARTLARPFMERFRRVA
jgi:Phytanoyl-CoA dioxygenase (PhyH)